jgi:2-polyprenyl-3-methyl-5-hydroxy-6-metoxy-1,4-benzoquinol methylase
MLNLGCGNSELSQKLIDEGGFKGPIKNLDYSEECIETMKEK